MKKKLVMALTLVCAVTLLAIGCGSGSKETAPAGDKEDVKAVSDAEKITGKSITVVTAGTQEPYSLLTEDGTWTGIDAEVWEEIEKRTGWEVTVKQATFDAVFGQLDAGRADVAANCWAVKPERTEKYYASIPYYGDAQYISVPESNTDIKEFTDLAGKKVGVTNGQASQTIVEEMANEYGFEVVLYEQSDIGYKDMTLGRLDAMASALTTINNYSQNTGEKFRQLDEKLLANNVAYFFPKTDDGKALCDEVNVVLQEMLDDGTIAGITEKWLFEDMTKLISK